MLLPLHKNQCISSVVYFHTFFYLNSPYRTRNDFFFFKKRKNNFRNKNVSVAFLHGKNFMASRWNRAVKSRKKPDVFTAIQNKFYLRERGLNSIPLLHSGENQKLPSYSKLTGGLSSFDFAEMIAFTEIWKMVPESDNAVFISS